MTIPITDTFNRTALLAVHDGTQATVKAALDAHVATGMAIVAGSVAADVRGQAALCTAVATAVRAFGQVMVITDGKVPLTAGPHRGYSIVQMIDREGARHADDLTGVPVDWPVLYLGDAALPAPAGGVRLRVRWSGWTAHVHPADTGTDHAVEGNVLAAIAAGALGVHEAFGAIRNRPGSDAGWRTITVNLWQPGTSADGPELTHAPAAWWIVGLGHLGQAYAWVMSWLTYADPARVEVVLQDTQRVVDANHSTGLLTPANPDPVRKTRLAAAVLERAGYDVVILDRRLDHTNRVLDGDYHVALLGVDSLDPRRLISGVGWRLAIDAGLGVGPADFNALLLRRFPAQVPSDETPSWKDGVSQQRRAPTAALADLERRDPCGSVQVAGTAVGAAFVGVVTACLGVAQGARAALSGDGFDVINLHLETDDVDLAPATCEVEVFGGRLLPVSDRCPATSGMAAGEGS
ncbi:hypothetical protein [Verrucosispora sp. WMMD573]|uniref:hypothetical protein n=1 Tax=Verrucosispora sp. WMMD573 TaxID=3015149 RepID=UPI00248BE3C1|nr:hypothetical protein [Verrucosispora sp. WMMD573]WBB56028.1 hypothetical protein O7601_08140 [Verrucosispora sp. WMMD573]